MPTREEYEAAGLFDVSLPMKVVAENLGIEIDTARRAARRFGVPPRQGSQNRSQSILDRYKDAGMMDPEVSFRQVALRMGVDYKTVVSASRRYGAPNHRARLSGKD